MEINYTQDKLLMESKQIKIERYIKETHQREN